MSLEALRRLVGTSAMSLQIDPGQTVLTAYERLLVGIALRSDRAKRRRDALAPVVHP